MNFSYLYFCNERNKLSVRIKSFIHQIGSKAYNL
jgi:hypothetical protein